MNCLSSEVQFTKNTVTLTNSDTTETEAEESKNCILQTNINLFHLQIILIGIMFYQGLQKFWSD